MQEQKQKSEVIHGDTSHRFSQQCINNVPSLSMQHFCSDGELSVERRETGDSLCPDPRPHRARLSDRHPRNGLWQHRHPRGGCQAGLLPLPNLPGLTQHVYTECGIC